MSKEKDEEDDLLNELVRQQKREEERELERKNKEKEKEKERERGQTTNAWYDEINKELAKRANECKVKGRGSIYDLSSDNPYKYKSIAEFKKRVPFSPKQCRFPNANNKQTDATGSYYTDVGTEEECKMVKGSWSAWAPNRLTKYGRGICWVDPNSAKCGDVVARDIIVPGPYKRTQEANDSVSQKCRLVVDDAGAELCSPIRMRSGIVDCMPMLHVASAKANLKANEKRKAAAKNKEKLEKEKERQKDMFSDAIPADFPTDITSPDANIQAYLNDWYEGKKGPKPRVGSLNSGSNSKVSRCGPNPASSSSSPEEKEKEKEKEKEEKDKKELDIDGFHSKKVLQSVSYPLTKNNREVLIKAIGYPLVKKLEAVNDPEIMSRYMQRLKESTDPRSKKAAPPPMPTSQKIWGDIDEDDLYYGLDDIDLDEDERKARDLEEAEERKREEEEEKQREREKKLGEKVPTIPQSVVRAIASTLHTSVGQTNRGILAWHSTGSGKLCTAAGVMTSFWNTDRQIVFASSLDAIASNPPFKFHECVTNLFQKDALSEKTIGQTARDFDERGVIYISFAKLANRIEKTEKFKKILLGKVAKATKSKEKEKKVKKGGAGTAYASASSATFPATSTSSSALKEKEKEKEIEKIEQEQKTPPFFRRMFGWYGLTVDDLPRIRAALKECKITGPEDFVDLDHSILIIDEVHNLFRPLANQKEKHRYVEKHLVDPTVHPDLKVAILTATPGDNVPDVLKLINILRNPNKKAITAPDPENVDSIAAFKNSIRGMVSYFEMSGDSSRFPKVIDSGPKHFPMSQTQFARYIEAYKDTKDTAKSYEGLAKANQLGKYWSGARKYSNMLYQLDKSMELSEFSSKLPPLLAAIQEKPEEKHYVYSAFYERRGSSQGIHAIAAELEKLGYEKLTVEKAKAVNRSKSTLTPGKKRYLLAIQSELGEEGSAGAGKNLHELVGIYNSAANKDGSLCHVFLASQSFNEGLDLKAVRHIHIFEPLVTMASDLQTIGRARRYCSHADLDITKDEWTVQIHRYFADLPRLDIDVKSDGDSENEKEQQLEKEGEREREKEIKDREKEEQRENEKKIQKLENEIEGLKEKEKETKDKENKKELKVKIKEKQTELKELQQAIKASIKERASEEKAKTKEKATKTKAKEKAKKIQSTAGIEAIDQKVYDMAQKKMRDLFVIYHSMKEAAVDCMILHKFHGDASVKCE